MADYLTNTTELTSIANAIRTKGNISESLVYPQGFITGINNITTGNSNIFSFINGSKTITMTLIDDLQTDYQTMKNDIVTYEYPSIDLETKLGRSLSQDSLIGVLLNLQINSLNGANTQYDSAKNVQRVIACNPNQNIDVTAFFNRWSLDYELLDQDQPSPWLIGGHFFYLQDGGPYKSVTLDGDSNFPNIRINKKATAEEHFKMRFRFDFTCEYPNGSNNNVPYHYSIENLYSMIIIEQNPTD